MVPGLPVRVSGRKLLPEFIHPLFHIRPGGLLVSEVTAIVVPLEIIIGVNNDPQFGPMIMVGMGGVFVEVFKDVALYPAPLKEEEALEMLKSLKSFKLLNGYRGTEKCDIKALCQTIVAISNYAQANKDVLKELDINPLFVYPEGKGVGVADALIVKRK